MLRTHDLSINKKLTLIIMLTSGVALVLASVGFALYDLASFREEKIRELSSFAEIIGASSGKALLQGDAMAAGEIFGSLPSDRHITAACLFSEKGHLLTGYVGNGGTSANCPTRGPAAGHGFENGHLWLSQRVFAEGERVGTVYIVSDMQELRTRLERYATIAGLVLLASSFVAFLLSARLRRVISDPILGLAEAARSISQQQDYSVRVESYGTDELGLLTTAFNNMLKQIQTRDEALRKAQEELEHRVEERTTQLLKESSSRQQAEEALQEREEQLRQSQKMEAIGRLAGGIAHDFNNLLTAITGYSEVILRNLNEKDPLRPHASEIKKAGDRAAALTRQLLAFSRRQVLAPKVLDLNAVVSNPEKMLRRLIGEDIELVTVLGSELGSVKADPGQLEQVILNLAVNARDAMPGGGRLVIETANVEVEERGDQSSGWIPSGAFVMLSVTDTGTGMDEETRARAFEPFFTTKEKDKGTGLGLSTVYGIIKQSGGHISVHSEVNAGTSFRIYLPQVTEEVDVLELEEQPADADDVAGTETILLVEDEQLVRDLARGILLTSGYKVLEAPHGGEALLICESYPGPIHLMLTDIVMPHLNGRELYERVCPLRPEMKVLFMSGYTDEALPLSGRLEPDSPFIEKPFTPDALTLKLRQVLDEQALIELPT
jgi:signal transduction histidine kinase